MSNFFSTDGFLWRAMGDLTTLVILNIITLLCCVPVITAGAALASMHYVFFQMIENQEGHIVPTFFRQFRDNLKNATPIWLILLTAGFLLYIEYGVFKGMDGTGRIGIVFIYAGVLILAMLSVWLFPLTSKFVLSLGNCFRNAFYLCITKLIRTFAMVLIMAVIPFILTQDMHLLPLAFLLGLSFPGYLCALICHPVFKDMIRKMQKQQEGPADEEGSIDQEGDLT